MRYQDFKNKAHLVETVSAPFYNLLQKIIKEDRGQSKYRRLPSSISLYETKPKFYLHDFETMTAYLIELSTMAITGRHYCGSGLSTIDHMGIQLTDGQSVPNGFAVVFLTSSGWGGGNLSWSLDIVSTNILKQIENSPKVLK